MEGIVFDIKHFALHDGSGIRQTIFLKGCPLKCWWCHNPESQNPKIDSYIKYNNIDDVPIKNKITVGKHYSVNEIIKEIEKDTVFFDESNGGVTFSGGEPLLHTNFLKPILSYCNNKNIHTALDTCGYATKEKLLSIIDNVDLYLYDIKFIDNEKHLKYTGVSNELILNNFRLLSEKNKNIIVRLPLIPEINSTDKDIELLINFLKQFNNVSQIDILPYHNISKSKYKRLNIEYKLPEVEEFSSDKIEIIKQRLIKEGFKVTIDI
ncbi:MAG: glycyl-radical enzyme activating protein [Bacteroidetes bacterium]|nr:glycyl-radical enzyme activating protein [Bacteroidota bacterium]